MWNFTLLFQQVQSSLYGQLILKTKSCFSYLLFGGNVCTLLVFLLLLPQAEQEYEDALAEGREAFLLERESETSDIFSCSLGNLPPKGEATLKLRYVQALAPEADGAVRFVLPAVLNPRYQPRGKSWPHDTSKEVPCKSHSRPCAPFYAV